ncbi:MAG TPA: (Fe-S)-binding protein [Candidatus Binatia bacterium]|nr:(Fe-S)-binding protein [Candidatus Binatia bacterium]
MTLRPPSLDLDALRTCVHCGICLPQCPTYRVLGEEMDSPRGRVYLMRALAEGRIGLSETFARHMDLCLGCRACESACPAGVPFGTLLEATRALLEERNIPRRHRRLSRLAGALFPSVRTLGLAFGALRLYQRSGLARRLRGGLRRLAPRLAAMEALLPEIPRRDRLSEVVPALGRRRGRAGLLIGCVQRDLFPDVNRDTAELLSRAGWEVIIPPRQGCCGALDLHAGRLARFRERARALVAAFPADCDVVVTNSAGCGSAMKGYGHWVDDAATGAFAARVRDVSEVLAEADLRLGPLPMAVTYHDPCHLVHGQKIRQEPRRLLARIPGLRLVPLADSELCCGSAGVYNLLEPEVADRLLDMKVARIAETGAQIVATGNPGCLLQIARGLRARGLPVEAVHPVSLLARAAARAGGESA